MLTREESIDKLRAARRRGRLALYLGAGVSVGSGLPTWEKLVLAMYFAAISEQRLGGWRPFPNYLYAIAEWHLRQSREPLEITARKLRKFYDDSDDGQDCFLEDLRATLYGVLLDAEAGRPAPGVGPRSVRDDNATLKAVAGLCEAGSADERVCSVITYNYDSLLEMVIDRECEPVYGPGKRKTAALPVAHVHGFVPLEGVGSTSEEIVFTEDQYHLAARDAYSWSNLLQIEAMSSAVGLMVGLSLSDRNMRRLLDATARAPLDSENYALLQRPDIAHQKPKAADLDEIHKTAISYIERFEQAGIKSDDDWRSPGMAARPGRKSAARPGRKSAAQEPGVKGEPVYRTQIRGIMDVVRGKDAEQQYYVMRQLGVEPIWYEQHEEIPAILAEIARD